MDRIGYWYWMMWQSNIQNPDLPNKFFFLISIILTKMKNILLLMIGCILYQVATAQPSSKNLFEFDRNSTPRWSSFENIKAEKGKGGMENNGAKGHPSDGIEPGETEVLLNVKGQGIINRMWVTIIDRSPEML